MRAIRCVAALSLPRTPQRFERRDRKRSQGPGYATEFMADITEFNVSHKYLDNNGSNTADDSYTVGLQITDEDAVTSFNSTSVTVDNVGPSATLDAVSSIDENG